MRLKGGGGESILIVRQNDVKFSSNSLDKPPLIKITKVKYTTREFSPCMDLEDNCEDDETLAEED